MITKSDDAAAPPAANSRAGHYLQQERARHLHPAIRELHQRIALRNAKANRRAMEFTRIARGHIG